VGPSIGILVGDPVSDSVGLVTGELVGAAVGAEVGAIIGLGVGKLVGGIDIDKDTLPLKKTERPQANSSSGSRYRPSFFSAAETPTSKSRITVLCNAIMVSRCKCVCCLPRDGCVNRQVEKNVPGERVSVFCR